MENEGNTRGCLNYLFNFGSEFFFGSDVFFGRLLIVFKLQRKAPLLPVGSTSKPLSK